MENESEISKLREDNVYLEKEVSTKKRKWTRFLILCSLTVAICGSFSYGYNLGSLNSPTKLIIEFIKNDTFLFQSYYSDLKLFKENELYLIGNETKFQNALLDINSTRSELAYCQLWGDQKCLSEIYDRKRIKEQEIYSRYNMTLYQYIKFINETLILKRLNLEVVRQNLKDDKIRIDYQANILWAIINCAFVAGGMLGGLSSAFIMGLLGRKNSILFHVSFIILGSILSLISPVVKSPILILASRILYGIQGGMACTFIPTYLSEIAPSELRGQIGVVHQLFLTIGIFVAQLLGLNQILGDQNLWNVLLAFPILPSILFAFFLLVYFPETPKSLLIRNNNLSAARKALKLLRNDKNVQSDIDEINSETSLGLMMKSNDTVRLKDMFLVKEIRKPLISALVLQVVQQFSGINAVFFYSSSIFKDAGIPEDYIQYAILLTGLVNVLATVLCVPLIDRLGRKPLLVYPLIVIVFDFILLVVFLAFQKTYPFFSYLSITCVMIYIISFAIGLGPIPFIYATECFRQNSRGKAISLCVFTNYFLAMVLTLVFPFMQQYLKEYSFLVFLAIVVAGLVFIIKKVPETKGKTIEDIIQSFD